MKEMFLLGAGASIDAGIPGAYKMTEEMIRIIDGHPMNREYVKVLYFVASGLLHNYGAHGMNPFAGINVEELFNAIQLISDREHLEITPFVYAWSPYIDDFELQISKPTSSQLDNFIGAVYKPIQDLIKFHKNSTASEVLEKMRTVKYRSNLGLRRQFIELIQSTTQTRKSEIFKETLNIMVSVLKDLVWIKDYSKLNYLVPLIKFAAQNGNCIATLNYDNSIELIGEQFGNQLYIDTGIEEWSDKHEFAFQEKAIPLIKLHGSINWRLEDETRNQKYFMPKQNIKKVNVNPSASKDGYQPAIIFGGTNKLTAKGPFLDLLRVFRDKLFESAKLNVIGYSFRDDHVNEYISQWINSDQSHKLLIIDPMFYNYDDRYHRLLQHLHRNERIELFQDKAKIIIPEIFKS